MELFLARLVGTQQEMGAQQGALMAEDARRLLAFYAAMPARQLAGNASGVGGAVTRAVVDRLATAWQERLARSRPPELLARARAFCAAAGAPAGAERTFATMDSMQNCVSVVARLGLGPFARPLSARPIAAAQPSCSTVIAWGDATEDGELLFARNFDFPGVGVWDVAPAFTVCVPPSGARYGFFAARGADTPVVTVVNDAGLVIAPHTRWHRGVTWGGGMIVDVVHEIARRAGTLADAVAIARELAPSSSWGIAVGSARERSGLVIEAAGGRVEIVRPAPGASFLACTNRYRSEALQAGQVAGSAAWALHADRREKRLRALVAARTAPLDPRALARMLGDRRDPEAPELVRHLGGIVAQPTNVHAAVIKPSARRAWVGVDEAPCCEGRWVGLGWDWEGDAGGWRERGLGGSGFAVDALDGFVAAHDPATREVRASVIALANEHDVATARAGIERAIAAAPEDPSLRLAATWLAMADGAVEAARAHAEAGLERETERYRRGQLLLWASRAASGKGGARGRYVAELGRLAASGDPGVDELVAKSARRWRGVPKPNLMMHDAY